MEARSSRFSTKDLGIDTWPDFEELFTKHNGVWGGCWCMYYHGTGTFLLGSRTRANQNKKRKYALVSEDRSHGILVYSDGTPVGWCQFGTREELPRLDNSRTYAKLGLQDGKRRRLWRITCFFVDRDYRGKGVAGYALKAALSAIRKKGGETVEAYPLESLKEIPRKTAKSQASFMWSGTVAMFRKSGFKVIAPLGKSRRLVRRTVN